MPDLTDNERAILEWLNAQRPAMLALLEALVNTDSGSYDKAGVDAAGGHLRRCLESHGVRHEVITNDRLGDAILAGVGEGANTTILLMGHREEYLELDTMVPRAQTLALAILRLGSST